MHLNGMFTIHLKIDGEVLSEYPLTGSELALSLCLSPSNIWIQQNHLQFVHELLSEIGCLAPGTQVNVNVVLVHLGTKTQAFHHSVFWNHRKLLLLCSFLRPTGL